MFNGERVKIYWNSSLAWAFDFGDWGYTIALSPDSTFLSSKVYLQKIDSSSGSLITSCSKTVGDSYIYLHAHDT